MSNIEPEHTQLTLAEEAGARFVEGPPGRQLMRSIDDAGLVVEACLSGNADSALLYAPNLTARFFDLSSGEAGVILQKLRNYRIRVAVRFSHRSNEIAAEESGGERLCRA